MAARSCRARSESGLAYWAFREEFLLRKFLLCTGACYLVILALVLLRLTDRPAPRALVALHVKLLAAVVALEIMLHAATAVLGIEERVLDARASPSPYADKP